MFANNESSDNDLEDFKNLIYVQFKKKKSAKNHFEKKMQLQNFIENSQTLICCQKKVQPRQDIFLIKEKEISRQFLKINSSKAHVLVQSAQNLVEKHLAELYENIKKAKMKLSQIEEYDIKKEIENKDFSKIPQFEKMRQNEKHVIFTFEEKYRNRLYYRSVLIFPTLVSEKLNMVLDNKAYQKKKLAENSIFLRTLEFLLKKKITNLHNFLNYDNLVSQTNSAPQYISPSLTSQNNKNFLNFRKDFISMERLIDSKQQTIIGGDQQKFFLTAFVPIDSHNQDKLETIKIVKCVGIIQDESLNDFNYQYEIVLNQQQRDNIANHKILIEQIQSCQQTNIQDISYQLRMKQQFYPNLKYKRITIPIDDFGPFKNLQEWILNISLYHTFIYYMMNQFQI
ncbi:UNKNOWN [Stylonychia lemnae]|uniref:Uncharacterized protein n=1 Tax=Stylonychia lemnae TaxID=5949 RepID=A0A078B7A7_STYLE|nr:UNKNOWN [Stylonychia lemnae]|eukprot:CDW90294.1 UNKNOWN [Stylonychia lemnae]